MAKERLAVGRLSHPLDERLCPVWTFRRRRGRVARPADAGPVRFRFGSARRERKVSHVVRGAGALRLSLEVFPPRLGVARGARQRRRERHAFLRRQIQRRLTPPLGDGEALRRGGGALLDRDGGPRRGSGAEGSAAVAGGPHAERGARTLRPIQSRQILGLLRRRRVSRLLRARVRAAVGAQPAPLVRAHQRHAHVAHERSVRGGGSVLGAHLVRREKRAPEPQPRTRRELKKPAVHLRQIPQREGLRHERGRGAVGLRDDRIGLRGGGESRLARFERDGARRRGLRGDLSAAARRLKPLARRRPMRRALRVLARDLRLDRLATLRLLEKRLERAREGRGGERIAGRQRAGESKRVDVPPDEGAILHDVSLGVSKRRHLVALRRRLLSLRAHDVWVGACGGGGGLGVFSRLFSRGVVGGDGASEFGIEEIAGHHRNLRQRAKRRLDGEVPILAEGRGGDGDEVDAAVHRGERAEVRGGGFAETIPRSKGHEPHARRVGVGDGPVEHLAQLERVRGLVQGLEGAGEHLEGAFAALAADDLARLAEDDDVGAADTLQTHHLLFVATVADLKVWGRAGERARRE